MFITNWLNTFLSWVGFRKDAKIVFLGLDNAGKTTLLSLLKTGNVKAAAPTGHPQKDFIQIGGINFVAFDLGGHKNMREIWESYCAEISGIVYMVDAADRSRFEESSEELQKILTLDSLGSVPVCVIGNKVDSPDAVSEEQLVAALGLSLTLTGKASTKMEGIRPMEVFMCSVVKRYGYDNAFKWIVKNC